MPILARWSGSRAPPKCEELASATGWELAVVRREAGGMMERWEGRWENNVRRYADLSCVKLILPWSTPSMRFCTSELKSAVIASYLKKRFPGRNIINVTGIRRQESPSRSKMPVSKVDTRTQPARPARPGVEFDHRMDAARGPGRNCRPRPGAA